MFDQIPLPLFAIGDEFFYEHGLTGAVTRGTVSCSGTDEDGEYVKVDGEPDKFFLNAYMHRQDGLRAALTLPAYTPADG